ncbi:LysR family transcriptional regulator [Rhizobium sp. AU243]|uniref:LysR family transcriptional regulator n=1 Tax=Rhizobium sp. AU243 TaxID=2303425 RepID=UPI0010CB3D27|nr:LysR family transcriptional regulator [Rhizobium sp. AU243]TKV70575.1 LysR family transcriptional regulator [Rhizobium sp. AU243]
MTPFQIEGRMLLNFRHLEIFRAVMATGSVTAAANQMGLTQSAVSKALRQFESALGISLFIRENSRMVPLPEASALLHEAEGILGRAARMVDLASDLKSGLTGPDFLRLAAPVSASEALLPPIIAQFLRERPNVSVETIFGTTNEIEKLVEERQVDIGIIRYSHSSERRLKVIHLADDESVCVMPQEHSLSSKSVITPRDLRGVPLIMLGRYRRTRTSLDQLLRRSGVVPTVKIETHTITSACAFAANGVGVAIVGGLFARLHGQLPILIRPFSPPLKHRYVIITLDNAQLPQVAKALISNLVAKFAKVQE